MRVFMSRSFSLYNTEGAGGGAKKETMERERVRHRHTHCSRRIHTHCHTLYASHGLRPSRHRRHDRPGAGVVVCLVAATASMPPAESMQASSYQGSGPRKNKGDHVNGIQEGNEVGGRAATCCRSSRTTAK